MTEYRVITGRLDDLEPYYRDKFTKMINDALREGWELKDDLKIERQAMMIVFGVQVMTREIEEK